MTYDIAIIGGGPGGYSCALRSAELGLKVILFEQAQIGGTCLNRGCVPTKYMAHVANLYSEYSHADRYGIFSSGICIDFDILRKEQNMLIQKLRSGMDLALRSHKITVVHSHAFVSAPNTIISENCEYHSKNILIATGSRVRPPLIEGGLTSDSILELAYIPDKLKIVGSGVVAVEFAYIFRSLGSQVTILARSERILRKWDREISSGISQQLKNSGIEILTNTPLDSVKKEGNEEILFAYGREPCVEGLFSECVMPGMNNGILVDEKYMTSIKNIFAVGDVINQSPMLAHVAMYQGRLIAEYIAGQEISALPVYAQCIYMDTEACSIGMTEKDAKQLGIPVICGKQTMFSNARTMISSDKRGFIKLIANGDSGKLIGAQMLCERASDISGELVLAIQEGIPINMLNFQIRAHPSYCEEISGAVSQLIKKWKQ